MRRCIFATWRAKIPRMNYSIIVFVATYINSLWPLIDDTNTAKLVDICTNLSVLTQSSGGYNTYSIGFAFFSSPNLKSSGRTTAWGRWIENLWDLGRQFHVCPGNLALIIRFLFLLLQGREATCTFRYSVYWKINGQRRIASPIV